MNAVPKSTVENQSEKILLRVGEYALYVIGKQSVKMGRLKTWVEQDENEKKILEKNDLIVRIPGISPEERPNCTVSHTQGVLTIFNGTLAYQDTSTFGTKIDDGDWFTKEIRQLDADCPSTMYLGDIPLELNPFICERRDDDGMCGNCGLRLGGVCSVVMWRGDDERELYLIVPNCCDLGKVLVHLADWILYKVDKGFEIRKPDGTSCPLNIGEKITYGDVTMGVEEFVQQ